jgi:hypothetical protein
MHRTKASMRLIPRHARRLIYLYPNVITTVFKLSLVGSAVLSSVSVSYN